MEAGEAVRDEPRGIIDEDVQEGLELIGNFDHLAFVEKSRNGHELPGALDTR